MNRAKGADENQHPLEIPIPEQSPEPVNPGELPDINVEGTEQHKFVDTDELVPQKEQPGKTPVIAEESGKVNDEEKQKCQTDNEPLGQPPDYDPEGNGEDVN